MNVLDTKVEKLDLEDLLKNYLDKTSWNKKTTLFLYDDVRITATLSSIDVLDSFITILVTAECLKEQIYESSTVEIPTDEEHRNLNVLYKKVHSSVFRSIGYLEMWRYKSYHPYLDNIKAENKLTLELAEEEANNLLDSLGIEHLDIRNAYIDHRRRNTKLIDESYFKGTLTDAILGHIKKAYAQYAGVDYELENEYQPGLRETLLERRQKM